MIFQSKDELQAKCAEWQKILRLQDWDVRTSVVRERDMKLGECNAEISVNMQHRLATLRIIDPIDFNQENVNPQDMERHLVHELLHIHLWPFTENLPEPLETASEQAINMIADALINLYRKETNHGEEKT